MDAPNRDGRSKDTCDSDPKLKFCDSDSRFSIQYFRDSDPRFRSTGKKNRDSDPRFSIQGKKISNNSEHLIFVLWMTFLNTKMTFSESSILPHCASYAGWLMDGSTNCHCCAFAKLELFLETFMNKVFDSSLNQLGKWHVLLVVEQLRSFGFRWSSEVNHVHLHQRSQRHKPYSVYSWAVHFKRNWRIKKPWIVNGRFILNFSRATILDPKLKFRDPDSRFSIQKISWFRSTIPIQNWIGDPNRGSAIHGSPIRPNHGSQREPPLQVKIFSKFLFCRIIPCQWRILSWSLFSFEIL